MIHNLERKKENPEMHRVTLGALAVIALITSPIVGHAATVATTAPLLGTELTSGRIRCVAANIDTKPKQLISMEMVSTAGLVLHALAVPALVNPGQVQLTGFADLSFQSPAYCRFVYQGKFRASLMYYNGTDLEVIPATLK
jgi:hypothetical protein